MWRLWEEAKGSVFISEHWLRWLLALALFCHLCKPLSAFNHKPNNTEINCSSLGRAARERRKVKGQEISNILVLKHNCSRNQVERDLGP